MKSSETINNLTKALIVAQNGIDVAIKDSSNPFFKSKYADLNSVIDACKSQLNKNGLLVIQPINTGVVETILIHAESGEFISSETSIICKEVNNPQAYGSAISYARRYGLQSMILLKADDDDGTAANKSTEPHAATKKESATNMQQPGTSCTCGTRNAYHAINCPANPNSK